MTSAEQGGPSGRGWAGRVSFTRGPEPIAYATGQIVVPVAAQDRAQEIVNRLRRAPQDQDATIIWEDLEPPLTPDDGRRSSLAGFSRGRNVPQESLVVRQLRAEGVDAQLNHVFFAHCGDCCGPHPSGAVQGSPVYATPVYATPVYATPVYATPVYATPVYATGAEQATGRRKSSAVPVAAADAQPMADLLGRVAARAVDPNAPIDVAVLDVGRSVEPFRPTVLGPVQALDQCVDEPDSDRDDQLDPVAGHTEFIVGLIKSIAPTANVIARKVLQPEGDGDEVTIAQAIDELPDVQASGGAVLNLSFGGYVLDTGALRLAAAVLAAQARGWVVVASAGNDGTCRRTYPAALPDVVSVGAIGPGGPAPFSNYGPWVRACAPGVDLVSTFFLGYTGDAAKGDFEGWARWSGTSFSAPIVAGSIVALKLAHPTSTAAAAATRLVDGPGLMKLRGLGTPVNVV